jgi:hypothetical protein
MIGKILNWLLKDKHYIVICMDNNGKAETQTNMPYVDHIELLNTYLEAIKNGDIE